IIGGLGRLVIPGPQPIGLFATLVCGLAGSIIGGLVGQYFGLARFGTILIEVAVAAAAVAVARSSGRRFSSRGA
ncbi:MAG: GlsB/YeaQ/YmgE family stress response membrane protein, partial [Pseudonocardiaceae bacterium]